MTIDKHTLDKAREWATENLEKGHFLHGGRVMAAAEVIQSLPDEWIDTSKLREALDWRDSKPSGDDYDGEFYDRLRALLPAPKPRTLADISPEKREACQWMQATVLDEEDAMTGVIQKVRQDIVWLMFRSGNRNDYRLDEVVPRDDLPRMEWPDDQFSDLPESAQETLKTSVEDYKAGRFVDIDSAPEPQVEIALGAWAMHPEHGKVLITSTRADSDGWVRVCMENDAYPVGAGDRHVNGSDLSPVPDTHDDSEETRPERDSAEPQPGEAWLVDCHADGTTEALYTGGSEYPWVFVDPDEPNERRWIYKSAVPLRRLVPAQEPRVFTTVEDYANAPVGTVLGGEGNNTWEKVGKSRWVNPFFGDKTNLLMSVAVARTVLWEPEA